MADEPDPGRRRFLKIATCGLGGGLGIAVAAPAISYLAYPAGRRIVTASTEPIDVGALAQLPADGAPTRVDVIAASVRDAWAAATNVALGAAWLRRDGDIVTAVSGSCPHLGGASGWNPAAARFACPCHDSAFAATGARLGGPAKRGLDPLPVVVEDGRVRLTWIRFKADIASREPA